VRCCVAPRCLLHPAACGLDPSKNESEAALDCGEYGHDFGPQGRCRRCPAYK
jgi:hypothetical protein